MKTAKFIRISILLVLGVCVVFAIFHNKKEVIPAPIPGNQEIPDLTPIVMEYKYLGKAEYLNNPHHYKWLLLEPGEPFTMSRSINTKELLKQEEQYFQFASLINFDFEKYELFISYGREVKELECGYDICYMGYVMSITYDKEYQGNTVFFYKIEKRNYVSPDFVSLCYWLDGEERVYLGDAYALTTPNKARVREHELWLESLQGDSE